MKQILIDVQSNHTKVALLENDELTEIYVEDHVSESIVGNIYNGRVENVLQGMQAAFIDIATDKNAFLYVKDAIPNAYQEEEDSYSNSSHWKDVHINEILKSGEEIMVQVVKEPFGNKGARVTTHITLPGRYVVLMPTVEYIGISRRIENNEEKERLKSIAENIKPDNMGLIIRTVAEGCKIEVLKKEVSFLLLLWEKIKKSSLKNNAPSMIHKDENIIFRTVRDIFTSDIDKFIINNREHYDSIQEIVSLISTEMTHKVEYYDSSYDLFGHYKLYNKITKMLNRKVWLRSGGYIVIDQTEALTSVDVNTGKFVGTKDLRDTVLKTNIEAAREIAKQLRLRDIGGIVIIDFIDMQDKEHEKLVIEVLKKALRKDRTKANVFGMTQLGLLEMTRKKVRQRAETSFLTLCPNCNGEGKISLDRLD